MIVAKPASDQARAGSTPIALIMKGLAPPLARATRSARPTGQTLGFFTVDCAATPNGHGGGHDFGESDACSGHAARHQGQSRG
jgi:hypothetical protein